MSSSPSHLSLAAMPADVWQAHTLATPVAQVVATGAAVLDAELPGGGWPVGALTELLQTPGMHCEWRLLAPALARCGSAAVVLVAPPHVPFGPALVARGVASQRLLWVQTTVAAQRLWATEQALRCAGVDAVLAWLPQARADQLRRLQMAASEYNRLLFVMRPSAARQESSPAVLRLVLEPGGVPAAVHPTAGYAGQADPADHLSLHILKRRGPPLAQALHLPACEPALSRLLAAVQNPWPLPAPPRAQAKQPLQLVPPAELVPSILETPHALDRAAA